MPRSALDSLRPSVGYTDAVVRNWNSSLDTMRDLRSTPGDISTYAIDHSDALLSLPHKSVVSNHIKRATWMSLEDRRMMIESKAFSLLPEDKKLYGFPLSAALFVNLQHFIGDAEWFLLDPSIQACAQTGQRYVEIQFDPHAIRLNTPALLSVGKGSPISPFSLTAAFSSQAAKGIRGGLEWRSTKELPYARTGMFAFFSARWDTDFNIDLSPELMGILSQMDKSYHMTGDASLLLAVLYCLLKVKDTDFNTWSKALMAIDPEIDSLVCHLRQGVTNPRELALMHNHDIDLDLLRAL
jgi:hypothetical protein